MSETDPNVLYDESLVPPYTLPELLVASDGQVVSDAATWQATRRSETLHLFRKEMYGQTPSGLPNVSFEPPVSHRLLDGQALCKQVKIQVGGVALNLLVYLPAESNDPVPLFVGLNFQGNHTVHSDPNIWISDSVPNNNQEAESDRGSKSSRWAVERIIERGYGLATIYCGDMAIDDETTWRQRVYGTMQNPESAREPSTWGAIGVWAWGLSRAMDYFETDADIDHGRVAVMGHSRLGKTALWAGAQDERFRMVISNNSGCGGAALSRRCFGETVKAINSRFPHWFCENFRRYNENEAQLPVDQHMLLALIAPRPLYVASAQDDLWADPRGEFLGIFHAAPIYKIFEQEGLPATEMPRLNQPVVGSIGYHYRTGGHDVTLYDWDRYLDFADRYL